MAYTQFAGIRNQLPAPSITAVAGGNLSGSGTIEVAMQARNRAGWNLPTALISVAYTAGQRIQIDIPATARAAGEDIHEFVFGIPTTPGTLNSIRQVAAWQAYDADQVTFRSLPAIIYLSEDEHIAVGSGQVLANTAALPTGAALLNGMIREVADIGDANPPLSGQSRILKYDAESTATVDNNTVFSAAVGRWLQMASFTTYVSDTTAEGGCDLSLREVPPSTVIQAPKYPVDGSVGTAIRYWYFGSRNASGPNTSQGVRVGVRIFDDGVERTQGFNGLFQITFNGYANPTDGTLDTSGMTTGSQVAYQYGKAGAHVLEKDLPAGQAVEFAIAPDFSIAEVSDLDQNSVISINLRAYSQSGDRNLLSGVNSNGINPEGDRARIVPDSGSVKMLSGSGCTPVLCFPLVDETSITGLANNTADQFIHITGNGIPLVGDGSPSQSERIRAKVSTASGRSDAGPASSYVAVTSGDTLTVTVNHGRSVRADYPEPSGATSVIAGNADAAFTPPQMAVYLERQSDGNIYEYLFGTTDTATQDVTINNLADADDTPGSIPGAPSANFSLFELGAASFTSSAGSSDLTADSYRVSVAYVYDGAQATIIQHESESSDWFTELELTIPEALSRTRGGELAYRYSTNNSAPPATAEIRFNAGETEAYISTTAQNGVNSSGLLDDAISGSKIYIFNRDDNNAHRIFEVTSNTDNSSYHTLGLTTESSQGTLDSDVKIVFVLRGQPGDDGNAATIAINSVTTNTLNPGESATFSFVNNGTVTGAQIDVTAGIPAGEDGTNGTNGTSAIAITTADFAQPTEGATVAGVAVDSTDGFVAGQFLLTDAAGGNTYQIDSIQSATELTLLNLADYGNAASSTTISSGAKLTPTGQRGDTGATGSLTAASSAVFTELGSDPATPSSGNRTLYAKSDGFYQKDSAGDVSQIGAGAGGGGTTIAAKVTAAAATLVANVTVVPVSFDTIARDDGSLYNGSNPTRLTVPVGEEGWYHINGQAFIGTTATGGGGVITSANSAFIFRKNGTDIIAQFRDQLDSANPGFNISILDYLDAGDYIELCVYHEAGSTLTTRTATGQLSYLAMKKD
ncbi:MAG: hypothetical protein AAF609_14945 [Cyanobacteria bacterium P01_C01_bin.120]